MILFSRNSLLTLCPPIGTDRKLKMSQVIFFDQTNQGKSVKRMVGLIHTNTLVEANLSSHFSTAVLVSATALFPNDPCTALAVNVEVQPD